MLAAMGHIEEATVDKYVRQFKKYDADGSGTLTTDDLDILFADMQGDATSESAAAEPAQCEEAPPDVSARAAVVATAITANVETRRKTRAPAFFFLFSASVVRATALRIGDAKSGL